MSENVILRTTKFGQTGFVIEDVNQYLDELNDKIVNLEQQLASANEENDKLKKALEGKGIAIPSESLAELADAKNEIERLKSQLESAHKGSSGGLNGARSADTIKLETELKNIKDENERLKKQVEFARQKLSGNGGDALNLADPKTEAELAEAKAEIEKLRTQMGIAKQRMEEIKAKFSAVNPAEVNALKAEITAKNQGIKSLERWQGTWIVI